MDIDFPQNNLSVSALASLADRIAEGDQPDAEQKPGKSKDEINAYLLHTVTGYCDEAFDMHQDSRWERSKDFDYYDNHQWDAETAAILRARGQAPLTYNLIAVAVDWLIGTERRTRIDWKIHPRGPEDLESAGAKQQVFKFITDANLAEFENSEAFKQAAIGGIGWLETAYSENADDESIVIQHEDWKCMWWDPFARKKDLSDGRYIFRRKWIPLVDAVAMFPQHAEALRRKAVPFGELDMREPEDLTNIPALYFNRDWATNEQGDRPDYSRGSYNAQRTNRLQVDIREVQMKVPRSIKKMRSIDPDLDGDEFDESNPAHLEAVEIGLATTTKAVKRDIYTVMFTPGLLLEVKKSPYKHGRYTFTPIIYKRDDKTGMPYGWVRAQRDPQDDYNKRRGKTLHMLSTKQVIHEDGVFNTDEEDAMLEELAAPDGRVKVTKGALRDKRIQILDGKDVAQGHIALMEQSRSHVLEGSGINRDNLGQESNATSGKAILAKQQQGAVATSELFDNYRHFIQVTGKKILSLIEQFMTMPRQLRIMGPKGKIDWLMVNEPEMDPVTGEIFFKNDIARFNADFRVDQQDYRETVRMAMAETLFDVIRTLPPEIQISLLDIAVELTDLPNREELAQRIRAINGQTAPGEDESPEAMLAKQQQQQDAERERAMQEQERGARIRKDLGQAAKYEAEAKQKTVAGKREALDTAALANAAVQLAPAADRLYEAGNTPNTQDQP